VELNTYVLLKAYHFQGKKTTLLYDSGRTERDASVAGKEQKSISRLTEGIFPVNPLFIDHFFRFQV